MSSGPVPAGPISLEDDCGRCAALCCVGLALTRSADFALDKPAGSPCPNLAEDLRCRIHADLPARGFPGCVAYTCYGAGPRVTAAFHPRDWRTDAEVGRAMFSALARQRVLHELLWHLRAARAEPVSAALDAELERVHALTEELAAGSAARGAEDIDAHRDQVNAVLLRASAELRGPRPGPDLRGADLVGARLAGRDLRRASLRGARLTGADLRGADLRRADLTGADLRGAALAGADLRGALFLTPPQLSSARVTSTTRLPGSGAGSGAGSGPGA